uniref:Uncharacterized protein n=1 Tax=Leersia perrieri TaxID=77586 RepID=A0A0D9WVC7_9ORYZ
MSPLIEHVWSSKGKVTMRSLCYVTFLAILSINIHFSACLRLLAENPLPAPAPLSPANIPANVPVNIPANLPTNIAANLPANIPANLPASLPANVPPETMANLPAATVTPEMLANLPPEVLAKLPADVSPEMLADMPPEMLVNLPPDVKSQLPAAAGALEAAAGNSQPGAGGENAAGAGAGIPQIPKMPDFSGLTDLSFPPMPSSAKIMPSMPQNITLFGFDVQIPKFINKMVDDETTA